MTGLPDYRITGLPDYRITGLPDYRITGLPDYRITGLPDYRITGLPDYRITGLPDYRITGLPDYRITGLPDHRITGLPDHRIDQPAPASSNPDHLTSPSGRLVNHSPLEGESNPQADLVGGHNRHRTPQPPVFPAKAGIHLTRRRGGLFSALRRGAPCGCPLSLEPVPAFAGGYKTLPYDNGRESFLRHTLDPCIHLTRRLRSGLFRFLLALPLLLGFAAGAQAQTVSISAPADANEGNSGTTNKKFTVSLSSNVSTEFLLDICITGGTATKSTAASWETGADYRFLIGANPRSDTCDTISLGGAGGSSNSLIGIQVRGDTDAESDETVTATITFRNTPPNGVTLGTATAIYTILDDDTSSDTTAPQITSITRQTPSTSPTHADTLKWRVTFNEPVQNVDAADFSITGTTATVGSIVETSSTIYDITISSGNLAGLNTIVTLELDNNNQNIQDTSGNALTNLTPTGTNDNTYDVDNLKPRVQSFTRQNPTTQSTSADTLKWRVTFNESVKNVDAADFRIVPNTPPPTTTATITSATQVTGNDRAYDVTASGGNLDSFNGTVRLGFNTGGHNIQDIAGNKLSNYTRQGTNQNTFTVTNAAPNNAPTVANMIPNQSATVGTAFTYAFPTNTFNDADNDNLTYSALKSDNSALPSWLTFTTGTRTFSGTPQSTDVGTLSVKVTAIDGNSGSISEPFNIVVSAAAPIIPTVDFSSSSSSVLEDAGTHNVTINLSSAAPSGGLTLTYTVGGNATAGSGNDFTIQNQGTLNVIAGATTATIPVVIIDDSNPITEPVETVILTLTDGTGYTPGSTTIVHTLTITDNDAPLPGTPALTLSQNILTFTEGTTGSYTIELATEPIATVTVAIESDNEDITISPSSPLTFTTTNWDTAQTVTVNAAQDDDTTHDTAILTHTASGGDYGTVTGSVTVTVTDDDTTPNLGDSGTTPGDGNNNNNNDTPPVATPPVIPPVTVSAQALTLTEGTMESYTLVLDSAPTESVTIDITPLFSPAMSLLSTASVGSTAQDNPRITVTPSTVVFTPDNWQTPQSITVQAQANENATEQTVQLIHRIKGSNQRIASVTLTIQPDTTQATTPWLSRMGRTLAEQAIDGIRKRMNASRTPGLSATLAGWSVPMNPSSGALDSEAYTLNPASQNPATGQTINAQDIVSNSHFLHTTGLDLRGGNTAFWGQVSETDFSGTQHNIHTQGESRTLQIGADYSVNDWMMGFSLLSSTTEGFSQRQAIQERMESNITALVPYSAKDLGDTRIWGALGFGQGTVSRYRENIKRNESDVTWQLLNIGANSEIKTTETVNLSLNTDALWVRTQSDESKQDHINPSISRIRAGLQSTWNHTLYNTELQPTFTIGARHDGGGAESGFGLYAGSGLRWTSPTVQIDIEGQYLLSHQQEIEEKGFSASLIHDRTPHSDLGLSLSLSQRPSIALDGLDSWWMAESVLTPSSSNNRWAIDAAYGLPAWDGLFTGIPYMGMGLDGDSRDIQLGWRMMPLATNKNLSLGIQATRLTQEQTAPKHWFGVEARVRW